MFLDQELLAIPRVSHPSVHSVVMLNPYEKENKKLWELPEIAKLCVADNGFFSSMMLKMKLVNSDPLKAMYSSRFAILGNRDYNDALGDFDVCDTVSDKEGGILFGVRLEPEINVPINKRLVDMRGEGLPGFWHITFGYTRKELMKVFEED